MIIQLMLRINDAKNHQLNDDILSEPDFPFRDLKNDNFQTPHFQNNTAQIFNTSTPINTQPPRIKYNIRHKLNRPSPQLHNPPLLITRTLVEITL